MNRALTKQSQDNDLTCVIQRKNRLELMVKSAVCRVLNWHIVDFQGVFFVKKN